MKTTPDGKRVVFKEIDPRQALKLIADEDLDDLYIELPTGAIDQAKKFNTPYDELTKTRYFQKTISTVY